MSAKTKVVVPAEEVARQVEGFIDKFEPVMAKRIREVRAALRRRFPGAVELVYDNYNFFVIGFCSANKQADCVCSVAADRNGVGLHFMYGAELADPEGMLEGSGVQNRFVRLVDGVKTLRDARVKALIEEAAAIAETPMPKEQGYTVVRSVSEKQRPRR
jgi:hypothetical protein